MVRKKILDELCERFPALTASRDSIDRTASVLISCFSKGGKVLICGNGGSCADSDHFAAELMKSFELSRPLDESLKLRLLEVSRTRGRHLGSKLEHSLPAISLTSSNSLITAILNDIGPQMVFAQQLLGLGNEGDVLVGISTSGNSINVINACITAKALNLYVIGITGKTGGKMKQFCDVLVNVPETQTARVQELHLPVLHTICQIIETHFYS